MWIFGWKGPSGFSACSTAEEVTKGIDGTGLTAINLVVLEVSYNLIACILTISGASSGIGTETTRVLALRGVHVVMAVRNTGNGGKVKEAILKENPNAKLDVMELDLGSMASVRKFASEYKSLGLALNLLINNAGVVAPPFMLTKDNLELQFGTNHIGKNHKSLFSTMPAYGQAKLANILHANELAKRLKEEGVEITANSLHPGIITTTNLLRHHGIIDALANMVAKYFMKSIPQGAATTCYVTLHPQVKEVSGEYFCDSNAKPTALAKDEELAKNCGTSA
ncbi:hypothetical protein RHSIM_Rhsim02G0232600 [Rhododendron simsii]|uniref:Uncharacterized protein n=1 Tax=Rhododendron simsii TaxID=118357 RepID=A0A834HE18_RHOSS|nr:hypothetical protein RHSIM_Rhsim02G0232600 [Rhododendron simsii]